MRMIFKKIGQAINRNRDMLNTIFLLIILAGIVMSGIFLIVNEQKNIVKVQSYKIDSEIKLLSANIVTEVRPRNGFVSETNEYFKADIQYNDGAVEHIKTLVSNLGKGNPSYVIEASDRDNSYAILRRYYDETIYKNGKKKPYLSYQATIFMLNEADYKNLR